MSPLRRAAELLREYADDWMLGDEAAAEKVALAVQLDQIAEAEPVAWMYLGRDGSRCAVEFARRASYDAGLTETALCAASPLEREPVALEYKQELRGAIEWAKDIAYVKPGESGNIAKQLHILIAAARAVVEEPRSTEPAAWMYNSPMYPKPMVTTRRWKPEEITNGYIETPLGPLYASAQPQTEPEPELPPGFTSVKDYIAKVRLDPEVAKAMDEATPVVLRSIQKELLRQLRDKPEVSPVIEREPNKDGERLDWLQEYGIGARRRSNGSRTLVAWWKVPIRKAIDAAIAADKEGTK